MKKLIALLMTAVMTLALFSCGNEEPVNDGRFAVDGCVIRVTPEFSKVDSADFVLALEHEDGLTEFRVQHLPDYLMPMTSMNCAVDMMQRSGVQQAHLASGATDPRLPDYEEDYDMAHYGYVTGEKDDDDFIFMAFRTVEGDGVWIFNGICQVKDLETFRPLFIDWAEIAKLTKTEKAE